MPDQDRDSVRTHDARFGVERWAGTLADMIALLQTVRDECTKRWTMAGLPEERTRESLSVTYTDGSEDFRSLGALAAAGHRIEPDKVSRVEYALGAGRDSVRVRFGLFQGLSGTVSSEDRVWAHGLAGVLDEQGAAGYLPEYKRMRRPWKTWEKLNIAVIVAAVVAIVVVVVAGVVDTAVFLPVAPLLVFPLGLPLADATDRRVRNPDFLLLRPGEAPEPEADQAAPGLTVRAQEFIRRRPLLNITLAIVLGIAINKVSDVI